MAKEKILIVDDERAIRWTLAEALREWDYQVFEAGTIAAARTVLEEEALALVLLDINLPDGSGLDALRDIKQHQPDTVVIMITSEVVVENILAALRGGAYDFIGKPIRLEELQVTIRNGIEAQALRKEVRTFRRERARQFSFEQLIGESPALREVTDLARKVAVSGATSILLQGESGTGKDLVAKAIHYASSRAAKPFVAINCAAIPATLLESELFGYEKGAFTDAKSRKEGLFEQAEGGTLFLDEIGELELNLQAKLLRVLEEGVFRRVGGLRDIALDVRVLAASNKDLRAESEAGRFRLDLYYRLSVIQIDIPPLRDRDQDVLVLAGHFIKQFNNQFHKQVRGLKPEVEEVLRNYQWRGNVRELRNVIERLVILEEGELLTATYLPRELRLAGPQAAAVAVAGSREAALTSAEKAATQHSEASPPAANVTSPESPEPRHAALFKLPATGIVLEEVEKSLVRQALELSHDNQTHAAALLGITRDQLRYRMKKLDETSTPGEAGPAD